MKNYPLIFIPIFCLFFQGSSVFSSEKELRSEELLSIYHKTIKELKLTQTYEGINDSLFDNNLRVIYENDDYRFNKKIAIIGRRAKFEMTLDPNSGYVLSIFNNFLREKVRKDNILYKKGEQPKRNKEEIIKEAEKYLKIINNGSIPEGYYFEGAHFSITSSLNFKIDYAGSWKVRWARKINGYSVWGDDIVVGINEDYGFELYMIDTPLTYNPPQKINISKDEAINLAKELGAKLINNKAFHFYGYCRGYKLGEITDAQIMILPVNLKDHTYLGFKPPNSRLCWLVNFRCISITPEKGDSSFPVGFCIDAETGELVGFR